MTVNNLNNKFISSAGAADGSTLRNMLHAEMEIQSLKDENEHIRATNRTKEQELKAEIDKLRQAKKDMECKIGGIDMGVIQKESTALMNLKKSHEIEVQSLKKTMETLQNKLQWYVDNQEMLDQRDALVADLKSEVLQLKDRLAQKLNDSQVEDSATKKKKSANSGQNKIRALENQVKELEQALLKRHPDSLSNLIRAAGPSDEEMVERKKLQKRVSELQNQLDEKDSEMNKSLRVLRLEHERVVASLKKQVEELGVTNESLTSNISAIKPSSKQVADSNKVLEVYAYIYIYVYVCVVFLIFCTYI